MDLIIYSIIVLITSIVLYFMEKKKHIVITPILLLAVPYCILLLYSILINYNGKIYENKINPMLIIISLTYIFVFFQTGNMVKFSFYKSNIYKNYIRLSNGMNNKIDEINNIKIYNSIIIISFLAIFIKYIVKFGLNSNIIDNLILLKNEFSGGPIAHLINVTNALLIISFSNTLIKYYNTKKLNKSIIFICFLWCLFLLVGAAKYTLMMFVGSIIIAYIRVFPRKIKIYKILLYMLLFPILFILVYSIRFISQGYSISDLPFEFIFSHLNFYIVSPFYAFSTIIEKNMTGNAGIGIILAPIINIFNIIFGKKELVSTIADFIDTGNGLQSTNVFTLFGAIQYEVGFILTVIIIMILSIFIYRIYYKSIYKPSASNIALYSYMGSSLLIAFFNCFYGTLNVWENIIVLILVSKLDKYKIIIGKGMDNVKILSFKDK